MMAYRTNKVKTMSESELTALEGFIRCECGTDDDLIERAISLLRTSNGNIDIHSCIATARHDRHCEQDQNSHANPLYPFHIFSVLAEQVGQEDILDACW